MIGRGYSIRQVPRLRSSDFADGWFVYVALCPIDDGEVFVKIGISTVPYTRIYTVSCNCPYPVEMAFFTYAGRKKKALAIERNILNTFEENRTRGEWLRMDTKQETKRNFAKAIQLIILNQTGSLPAWRKATGIQIRDAASVKMGERLGRKPAD